MNVAGMRAIGGTRRYAIVPVDGYSIEEAAEVLGVPKRRVRELVARGVILGTQEDDGELRVYLQPRPPAALRAETETDPGFEASPFRELLNEFRNLTERYGQALLALGESRGEVAALRGRIEALETRVDLRLGTSAAPSVVEWHAPAPTFEAETLADLTPDETSNEAAAATEASMPLTDAEAADDAVVASAEALLAEAEATDDAVLTRDETTAASDEPSIAEIEAQLAEAEAASEGQGVAEETAPEEPPSEPETDVEVAADAPESEPVAAEAEASVEEEPASEAEPVGLVERPEDAEAERAPRPRRAGFAAAGIAEALARAMDPSAAELPAPPDLAGMDQPEPARDELTAIEEPTPIDESRYSTAVEEPDWLAEDEFTWLDAGEREGAGEGEDQAAASQSDAAADQTGANAKDVDQAEPAGAYEPPRFEEEAAEAWAESEPEPSVQAEPEIAYAESAEQPEAEPERGSEPEIAYGESAERPDADPESAPEVDAPASEAAADEQPSEAEEAPVASAEPEYSPPSWDDWEFASTAYAATSVELPVEVAEPSADAAEPVTGALPDESIDLGASAHARPDDTGEVALMWLGSEFDHGDDYVAEIEVGTAGWHRPGGSDELTRIAADQGWDATEVEAIRNLLEPTSEAPVDLTDAPGAPADEQASAEPSPAEPEAEPQPEPESATAEQTSEGDAAEPQWPEADRTVSFSLPGGDDLQRALEALGLPSRSGAERQQTPTATAHPPKQPRQWSKISASPESSTARSTAREQAPPQASASDSTPDAAAQPASERPRAWTSTDAADHLTHGPIGEPEWLRGRRDPAARAFRRLRRIFPG